MSADPTQYDSFFTNQNKKEVIYWWGTPSLGTSAFVDDKEKLCSILAFFCKTLLIIHVGIVLLCTFLLRSQYSLSQIASLKPFSQAQGLEWLQRFLLKRSVEWSSHERHFCSLLLIFYFLDLKFSNFFCPSELHPLIWFFLKYSFGKKKNIRKTTKNALAPSIFIVLSIVLKLGTPLLHIQAQNTLLQNFKFHSRSRDMDEKPPKTLFILPSRLWRGITFFAGRN